MVSVNEMGRAGNRVKEEIGEKKMHRMCERDDFWERERESATIAVAPRTSNRYKEPDR